MVGRCTAATQRGRCDQTARRGHRGRNASLRSYIGRRNRFGRYCVDSTRYRTVPVRATQVALSFQSRDAASDRRELLHPHRYPPRRFISRQLLACHRLNSPTVGSSVSAGTNNLDAAIRSTDGPIFVAGLSQGTLVLDREQARLANDPTAPPLGNSHSSRPATLTIFFGGRLGREPTCRSSTTPFRPQWKASTTQSISWASTTFF